MTGPQPEPTVPLRDPAAVMRLARLGAMHQSRLSFLRVLLRRMRSEGWTFGRPCFDVDRDGTGVALYTARGPERVYTLVAFAHDLPPEQRSDRVIATAWDATFALFDGVPEAADVARLRANVPLQEAGRVSSRELSLSRANRSVRLWDHVVERLAAGRQPDPARLAEVGYLMRTTAVYGSGKFGAADREAVAPRPELTAPFQVEMLTVYLIRTFVADLVEHMARARNPEAARLDPALRRGLGIGNSTGLGMAPFLLNHPVLLNNWIAARETALARVRSVPAADPATVDRFAALVRRARANARAWRSEHPLQVERLAELRDGLRRLGSHLADAPPAGRRPWDEVWRWSEANLGLEAQEQVVSLLLELYPDLVDPLADAMAADEAATRAVDGRMTVGALRAAIARDYGWALDVDWDERAAQARIWYVSAEKLEPRLGERFEEDLDPYEQPLAPGREVAALDGVLARLDPEEPVGIVLMRQPALRQAVRRVQMAARHPYAEIRDNTVDAAMLPIDLLRAKLGFFGARHFDPRSDRWVRINLYQGAPMPDELAACDAGDWSYPPDPGT